MNNEGESVVILYADDDPEDQLLVKKALERSRLKNRLEFVEDGEELLDYLKGRGKYAGRARSSTPHLILLDLNMPKKNGLESLKEIKSDPELKHIPVVVLTTSDAGEDVNHTYELGASGFITKPVDLQGLVGIMEQLGQYWFEVVKLPSEEHTER